MPAVPVEEGISPTELKHVAILAIPTIGFPQAVKGLTWIEDVIRSE
jgi:alkylhydroperoxidase/carboxymuconolactone decarboxylase family protein YurZ